MDKTTKAQVHGVLVAARAKIARRKNWTQIVMARDARGVRCRPESKDAVCFCAVGAVESVTGGYGKVPAPVASLHSKVLSMLNVTAAERHGVAMVELNDGGHDCEGEYGKPFEGLEPGTHEAVLAVYDECIEATMEQS